MTELGWSSRPTLAGLYHARRLGENESTMIEFQPPDKYRKFGEASELQELPSEGYEYRLVEDYAGSV